MPLTGSEMIIVFAGAGLTVLGAYASMSKKKTE
jgi:LPXTG-motif cell wall-anchored protein